MSVTPYLTLQEFRERTTMPDPQVDALENKRPGFILKRLAYWTSEFNATLAKRYLVPPPAPIPEVLLGWLTDVVTFDAYIATGFNPGSEQDATIGAASERAQKKVEEAANGANGLISLPLKEGSGDEEGISRGGPLGSSEASPYAWLDAQAEANGG